MASFFTTPKLSAWTLLGVAVSTLYAADSEWLRPQGPGDPLIWGRRDGIVFGLPSNGGLRGPRGLIRVGVISPKGGAPELLNFIAIEPVILGPGSRFSRMAFSELEPSRMDPALRGKRLWLGDIGPGEEPAYRGNLETFPRKPNSIERLSVRIEVERFTANGAHVYLIASLDSDHPNELRLSVFEYQDSSPLEELTVTATMGNYERLRWLWLRDQVVDSRKLYRSYSGDAFIEHGNYVLEDMLRTEAGGAIALCSSNEEDPSKASNPEAAPHWRYDLPKYTQYWRVDGYDIEPDLRVRVNGRRVYWQSHNPLPGGIAFENFELRQRYRAGQTFVFGATQNEPGQMTPMIEHLPSPPEEK